MNRISELRKKLGLTQTRLGEEIGVSQQTISKYEKVDENISGDMDQYNRDTWIIIGKRLLGGQLHKYNEDSIIEKRLKE